MAVPETGMDMGFLAGCWTADARVEDIRTGWPLRFTFCFSGRIGRGTVKVEEIGRTGRSEATCVGDSSATLSRGRLEIRSGRVKCPGTIRSYDPAAVVCLARPGAVSECSLRGVGSTPLPVRFSRQEGKR
jgi:hypothetical protein